MTYIPEPLAFPSEAKTAFVLMLCCLLLVPANWTAISGFSVWPALFFTFVLTWLWNQRKLHLKYLSIGSMEQDFDAAYVMALASRHQTSLDRVVFYGSVHDRRALTFSCRGKLILVLGKGLRLVRKRQPEIFDAVVFHEFGHIVNGDVTLTQVARVLLIATLLLALGESLISVYGFDSSVVSTWKSGAYPEWGLLEARIRNWNPYLRTAAIPFIQPLAILFIYKHFLREREYLADSVAAKLGAARGLLATFSSAPRGMPSMPLSSHPTASERAANCADLSHFRVPYPTTLALLGAIAALGMGQMTLGAISLEQEGKSSTVFDVSAMTLGTAALIATWQHTERAICLSLVLRSRMRYFMLNWAKGMLYLGVSMIVFTMFAHAPSLLNSEEMRGRVLSNPPIAFIFSIFFTMLLGLTGAISGAFLYLNAQNSRPGWFQMTIVRYCCAQALVCASLGVLLATSSRSLFLAILLPAREAPFSWANELVENLEGTSPSMAFLFASVQLSVPAAIVVVRKLAQLKRLEDRRDFHWFSPAPWLLRNT